jgi:hypothetical protein
MKKLLRAAGLGLGLALAGVALWAAIAYLAHRDLGLMMPVVGALAGIGVYVMLRPPPKPAVGEGEFVPAWKKREMEKEQERERKKASSDSAPMPPWVKYGLVAAGIAFVTVAAGKVVADALSSTAKSPTGFRFSDNDMIKLNAKEICEDRQAKGEKLKFPPGITLEGAYRPQDFPPGVWEQAEAKWKQTPASEQQKRNDEEVKKTEQLVKTKHAEMPSGPGLFGRLDTFDFVWFLAALGVAFGIGTRAKPPAAKKADGDEAEEAAE